LTQARDGTNLRQGGRDEWEYQEVSFSSEQVTAGQAVYTKGVLSSYDIVVLGFSNRFLWKCPTGRLLQHYNQHVTANHLDVGVGTGYFLDHCRLPSPAPRIGMLDLNPHALDFASRRIARFRPEKYLLNVLEPISIDVAKYDSVGVNYLLHCLPGSIEAKAVALDHLKAVMNPDAALFGSTLLQGGVPRSWGAQRLMDIYNKKGIFSNRNDTLDGLERALRERFRHVTVETVGCAALFAGRMHATD
jgi:hypothetical protein